MAEQALSDADYIALMELRDAENRRSIRALTAMLSSAMDRIEELEKKPRLKPEKPKPKRNLPNLLGSREVAELLGISKASALKFIKAIGGINCGNTWRISAQQLDDFITNGEHVSLTE